MKKKLEFFYDYVSPYSYLANSQIHKLKEVEVLYRPILLGAVMQATKNSPPGNIPEKGIYLISDIQLWAKHYGIPYRTNSIFPQNTLKALRLAIAAHRFNCFEEIHQSLFHAMFVDDKDLSRSDVLIDLIKANNLDEVQLIESISNQAIKDELKNNTEEAISRGVFGAPTFFIDGEMFFGNDRIQFIEKILSRGK